MSAYLECPKCYADIRLRRADRHWVRCAKCGHEHDPSEGPDAAEWRNDD
jgi:rubredoxin